MRIALLILLIAVPACRRDPPFEGANVVVVVVDTLRRDRIDAPGNRKRITECLNDMAREGFVFKKAVAPCTWTKPSVASLFTGLYPGRHGAVGTLLFNKDHMYLDEDLVTLAERFQDSGYGTAAFVTNPHLQSYTHFDQGFDTFEQPVGRAGQVFGRASEWVRSRNDDEPFFLYLHALDPHSPYYAPLEYRRLYTLKEPGPEAPLTRRGEYVEIMLFMEQYRKYTAGRGKDSFRFDHDRAWMKRRMLRVAPNLVDQEIEFLSLDFTGPDDPALKERIAFLISMYDAEVAYTDDMFGEFLALLEREGKLDNTLVVVTSDHGEAFLEHGFWGHGHAVFAEEVNVPMLFHLPRNGFQGSCDEPVSLVDVAPTLLDLTGIEALPGADGLSLRGVIEGEGLSRGQPVFTEAMLGTVDHVGAYLGGKKLMRSALEGKEVEWRLFDIEQDPDEQHPLDLEGIGALKRAIEDLIRNRTLDERRSGERAEPSEEEIRQLRELGYL